MDNVVDSLRSRQRRQPTNCKICHAPAVYSYVGVIVCPSCKMFFKRNAEVEQNQIRSSNCQFDGNCSIHFQNRPLCSSCRLTKCFDVGMNVDLFRGTTSKKGQRKDLVSIQSMNFVQSPMTTDQWTHLSNIVHCYDEYSQYSLAQTLLDEQNRLPTKIRFRSTSIFDAMNKLAAGAKSLYEKNIDFLSLNSFDRTILLRRTIQTVTTLNNSLFTYTGKFLDIPICRTMIDMIYGRVTSDACYRTGFRLDPDLIFVKLILSSLMFSTNFLIDSSMNSHDVRTAIRIQDQYIELAWRYMIYKYDFERAVRSFSNLILSLLAVHQSLTQLVQLVEYNQMIESMINGTEQIVLCHDEK